MMISTKGRYALRIIIDLAQHSEEGFISLKEIAERQEISMKYLETIVSILNKARLVKSMRGKDGGYMLVKPASEYTIGSIIHATEGGLTPVSCLDCAQDQVCERADCCLTLPMWQKLDKLISGFLDSISVADLLNGKID
ncbi:MAG: RrF2 family transcriptional regulator [Oscillospiraceae bacterium]